MAKPLNYDEKGCSPISSNCVIWQGPDIECLNLCRGDTVSDVVYKLALEICDLLVLTDVDTYDISCFQSTLCAPTTFDGLIQFMINRICNLEECTGCRPDCEGESEMVLPEEALNDCCANLIPLATCLYYLDDIGNEVHSLSLTDYVIYLGNLSCSLDAGVRAGQSSIEDLQERVTDIETEIAVPYVYTPPDITPVCVMPTIATDPFIVLAALEQNYCELLSALGDSTAISNAMGVYPDITSFDKLAGSGAYSSMPGWDATPNQMADSFSNLWLAFIDAYAAIKDIQINCCPSGCADVKLEISAVLIGTNVTIFLTGTVPAGFSECNPSGTTFTIEDTYGGSVTITVGILAYLNNPAGYTFSISGMPINPASDLIISTTMCVENTSEDILCERCMAYTIINSAVCPSVLLTATETTITYAYTTTAGLKSYSMELWNATGSTMITNHVVTTDIVQIVNGTFTGLTASTTYKVRLAITVGTNPVVYCVFNIVTTAPPTCPPPTGLSLSIT